MPQRRRALYLSVWSQVSLKRILRALWVAAIAIVTVGSLLPGDSAPMQALSQLPVSDKVDHAIAYAILAWLPAIHERRKVIVGAALGALVMGVGLEYAQLYSGWRDFEVGDMVADAVGAGCGFFAALPMRSAAFFSKLQY
jgi:VanZ family protein